jgi:hypothetical protein
MVCVLFSARFVIDASIGVASGQGAKDGQMLLKDFFLPKNSFFLATGLKWRK